MDVLFAVMPFAELDAPAIGVSLLKAEVAQAGLRAKVRYFAFDLATLVGLDLYDVLAGRATHVGVADAPPTESLLGEWFFAQSAFGERLSDDEAYLQRFVRTGRMPQDVVSRIVAHRRMLDGYVDRCVEEIRKLCPPVVGFTTTFYQTCPALAVARRLKERRDAPVVMFGGANCAGPMGLQMIRSFPWIDYVCTGEGDVVVPRFLVQLLRHGDTRPVPGMLGRGKTSELSRPAMVTQIDELPVPDYTDYFAQHATWPLRERVNPKLLIESARGCWWGEKHHCTFCGLNAEGMAYRAKSADRVLAELKLLHNTYGIRRIDCIDNILHMQYLRTLFPRLIEEELAIELFYETKANLRWKQLRTMKQAGVWCFQPGIESFSDEVLAAMRKGCTGLQNIQVLRWGRELGFEVIWNIVYGFPGEPASAYQEMAELVPLLTHLEPPAFVVQIRLDRFSPNFDGADRLGLVRVRPAGAYRYIYPVEDEALRELAYFFDFEYADGRDPKEYTRGLRAAVDRWAEEFRSGPFERPRLDLGMTDGETRVHDTRACATRRMHVLEGIERAVYLSCDVAHSLPGLCRELVRPGVTEDAIVGALDTLVGQKLMVQISGRYLSLALFRARQEVEASQLVETEAAGVLPVGVNRETALRPS